MFTRCPECSSVHELNASLLAHASGAVRCGQCDCTFNALSYLFDHWPDSDSRPSRPGAGPGLLGPAPGETGLQQDASETSATTADTGRERPAYRAAWMTGFVLLVVITVANLGWTFREPLLENPVIRDSLARMGALEEVPAEPYRDPSVIHLVSRDMHSHPTREGLLVLSAVFVSRAEQSQAYPVITLTLTDAANQPLARRTFPPEDYLPGGHPVLDLAPQVHVPILLEFVDPGERAVGFQLDFE